MPTNAQGSAYMYVRRTIRRGEELKLKNSLPVIAYLTAGSLLDDTLYYLTLGEYLLAFLQGAAAAGIFYIAHVERIKLHEELFLDGFIEGTTKTITQVMKTLEEVKRND